MRLVLALKPILVVLAICRPFAGSSLEEPKWIAGAVYHLDRAKGSLAAGQLSTALAHTQMILHLRGLEFHVNTTEVPEGLKVNCQNAAIRAILYWNGVLGTGSLQLVDATAPAKVDIWFKQEVLLKGTQVGGYCSQNRSITTSSSGMVVANYQATILARYRLPGGKPLDFDSLTNIVVHEIGHVYGLGDSSDRKHLMGPLDPGSPITELQPDEIEVLMDLRRAALDIQRKILTKSGQATFER